MFSTMQAVTNYLKDAVIGAEIKLEFEKDSISLDIPCEGTEVNGWVIQVITPTVVRITKLISVSILL